jgi:outer membrane protein
MKLNASQTSLFFGLAITCLATAQAQALSLTQAVNRALAESQGFKASESGFNASQQVLPQARAALFPSLILSGQYDQYDWESGADKKDHHSWRLNLSQPLFNLQAYYGYQLAKSSAQGDRLVFEGARQALIYQVTDAYLSVLNANEQVRLAQENLSALEQTFAVAQGKLEVGSGSRLDLLEAQARRDAAKANLILAKANQTTLLSQLAGQLELPEVQVTALNVAARSNLVASLKLEELIGQALGNNPTLAQIRANMQGADANRQVQRAAHYPTLTLRASMVRSESDPLVVGQPTNDETVSLIMEVPLFSGGSVQAKTREAGFLYDKTRYELGDFESTLSTQVKQVYSQLLADESRIEALRLSIESSESFLDAAQTSYQVGLKALVDVLNARASLYDAQAQFTQAVYDSYLRRLQLEQLMGDLTPDDLALLPGA